MKILTVDNVVVNIYGVGYQVEDVLIDTSYKYNEDKENWETTSYFDDIIEFLNDIAVNYKYEIVK